MKEPDVRHCAYCGSGFELGVDHIVPVSAMFSGRRSGTMKSYGETVICCRECNSILGSKHYHTRHARALYLVERYANRLQNYAEDNQVDILDKLTSCIVNYQSFLLSYLDSKTSVQNPIVESDAILPDADAFADVPTDETSSEPQKLISLRKKRIVNLDELVGLFLSDIKNMDDGVMIRDFFVRSGKENRTVVNSLIRRLSKSHVGRLATFRDQTLRAHPDAFSVSTKAKLIADEGQLFLVALVLHADLRLGERAELHKLASWFE